MSERPPILIPAPEHFVEFVEELMLTGLYTREELVNTVKEAIEGEFELSAIEAVVTALWETRLLEEALWDTPSDADRLEEAFGVLAQSQIFGNSNLGCCLSCGIEHAEEVAAELAEEGEELRGYVFFHAQDAEMIPETGAVHLAFGPLGAGVETMSEDVWDAEAVTIGVEVMAALQACGLEASWDESAETRIHVELPDWRVRLPA